MFCSLPPQEQVVAIVSISATDNVQACRKHRFGCGDTLILVRNARGFSGLLHWPKMAMGKLTTCFVLVDVRDCLIILDFKIIQFYNNYNKLIH